MIGGRGPEGDSALRFAEQHADHSSGTPRLDFLQTPPYLDKEPVTSRWDREKAAQIYNLYNPDTTLYVHGAEFGAGFVRTTFTVGEAHVQEIFSPQNGSIRFDTDPESGVAIPRLYVTKAHGKDHFVGDGNEQLAGHQMMRLSAEGVKAQFNDLLQPGQVWDVAEIGETDFAIPVYPGYDLTVNISDAQYDEATDRPIARSRLTVVDQTNRKARTTGRMFSIVLVRRLQGEVDGTLPTNVLAEIGAQSAGSKWYEEGNIGAEDAPYYRRAALVGKLRPISVGELLVTKTTMTDAPGGGLPIANSTIWADGRELVGKVQGIQGGTIPMKEASQRRAKLMPTFASTSPAA